MEKAKVYTTTRCPYCRKVKDYLRRIGMPFVEYNLDKNPKYVQEVMRLTHQTGVPVVILKGRKIIGFDKSKINETLGIK
jgi:glutaredoxin-like YruB-family protein